MPHDNRPIGIFDSGIGGLTVVRAVQDLLPDEPLIYLGDTARVPYGTKTRHTVTRYAHQVARVLLERDVKMLVVACNTASAQALPALQEAFSEEDGIPVLGMIQGKKVAPPVAPRKRVPIVGVIEPGAQSAMAATTDGNIGVIGTEGTILNGAYQRALQKLNPDVTIHVVPCPLFVSLAEEGWTEGAVPELVAREYLTPLIEAGVDTLILGCTHYPLLRPVIRQVMGDAVQLVDSAPATARAIRAVLQDRGKLAQPGHQGVCYVATDHPDRFRRVGSMFLKKKIDAVEVVDL